MHSGKLNWIELSWTVRRRNWRPSQVLHNWGILSRIGQSMQYLSLGENRRRPATAVAGSWLSRLENLRGYDGRRRSSQLVAGSVESVHSGKLNWTQQNWTERSSSVQLSSVFRCAFGLRIGHLNWTELNWTEHEHEHEHEHWSGDELQRFGHKIGGCRTCRRFFTIGAHSRESVNQSLDENWRRAATTGDSPVLDCQEPATCDGRCRSSQLVAGLVHSGKPHGTELNDPVEFSWVQFSYFLQPSVGLHRQSTPHTGRTNGLRHGT